MQVGPVPGFDTARRSLRHDQIFGYDSLQPEWGYDTFLNRHIHPDERAHVDRAFRQALAAGTECEFECRIVRTDQAVRWIWAKGSVDLTEGGKPQRMVGLVMDITDRRRAEEAARLRSEQVRRLAEVATRLTAALDVSSVTGLVTEEGRVLIGAHQAVTSFTTDQNGGQAINAVSLSDKYAAWRPYDAPPEGSGIYAVVCRTNRPMRLTRVELEAHPAWKGFGKEAGKHPRCGGGSPPRWSGGTGGTWDSSSCRTSPRGSSPKKMRRCWCNWPTGVGGGGERPARRELTGGRPPQG